MENKQVLVADKYAIFQIGTKQYQAVEGKTVAIELIAGQPGDKVEFSEVLLHKNSAEDFKIGQPFVEGAKVKASIVKNIKEEKKIVFKFKRRKKSRVKSGHRQQKTVVRIEAI